MLSCLAQDEPSNQLAIATGIVKLLEFERAEMPERVKQIMAMFNAAPDFSTGLAHVVSTWLSPAGQSKADAESGNEGAGTWQTAFTKMKSSRLSVLKPSDSSKAQVPAASENGSSSPKSAGADIASVASRLSATLPPREGSSSGVSSLAITKVRE